MGSAEEARRVAAVSDALLRLGDGEWWSRGRLFPRERSDTWLSSVLTCLVGTGFAEREGSRGKSLVRVRPEHLEEYADVITSARLKDAARGLLWPDTEEAVFGRAPGEEAAQEEAAGEADPPLASAGRAPAVDPQSGLLEAFTERMGQFVAVLEGVSARLERLEHLAVEARARREKLVRAGAAPTQEEFARWFVTFDERLALVGAALQSSANADERTLGRLERLESRVAALAALHDPEGASMARSTARDLAALAETLDRREEKIARVIKLLTERVNTLGKDAESTLRGVAYLIKSQQSDVELLATAPNVALVPCLANGTSEITAGRRKP